MRRSYSDEERQAALALYETDGPTAVQTQLGVPKATVTEWAQANGIRTIRNERTRAAIEALEVDREARTAALAEKLLQIAEAGASRELEVIGASKLRDVVGSRTRAVHDLQLLTGAPTSRGELGIERHKALDEGEERGLRLVG
jgi:transposase-like protein